MERAVAKFLLAVIGSAVMATAGAEAAPRASVERVPSRAGVTQPYYLLQPDGKPRAIAIVFLGGDGELALDSNGPNKATGNFLMRLRYKLAAAGLMLAYPDVPSDRTGKGLANFRSHPDHAGDIKAVVQAVKTRADLPVFLIGTSRGTVSAANAAARLGPNTVAGVILTATVTERAKNSAHSVHDTPLAEIRAPLFALSHRDDGCYVTPPSAVPRLLRAAAAAPRKDSRLLTGGPPPKSGPCEAKSQHGFLGIEDQAVKAMAEWIDSVLAGK